MVFLPHPIAVPEVSSFVIVGLNPFTFHGHREARGLRFFLQRLNVAHVDTVSPPDGEEAALSLDVAHQSFVAVLATAVLDAPQTNVCPVRARASYFICRRLIWQARCATLTERTPALENMDPFAPYSLAQLLHFKT